MTKFRPSPRGSNVVHRLELPLSGRQRSRRSSLRYQAAGANGRVPAVEQQPPPPVIVQAPPTPVAPAPTVTELPRPAALKDSQARHQIQLLERRLAKMARLLEERDQEVLSRSNGAVDAGVSSIYREVQGIGGRSEEAKRKRAFMSLIFEANLKLRESITSAPADAE